ncbi:putative ATPase [Sulfolobus tengchongensis spindle-shaped virus 3]|nr:putative ATPase [Sulfolobus tengchongensis spindle-shaped virus 3]
MEVCEKLITAKSVKDGQILSSETEGVRFVTPDPCVFNQTWFAANPGNIKLIDDIKIERIDLHFNRSYKIISPDNVDYYIFPKEIGDVIDILLKNPFQSILLYGAPGTGKTSIVEILSKYYGFTTVWIRPYALLEKYVGESEKQLKKLFIEAESDQPSIVVFDDGEWLLRNRPTRADEGYGTLSLNLINQVLERLNLWRRSKQYITVIATTNVKLDTLDQAIISRFNIQVPFPLPDYEAISAYLLYKGVKNVKFKGMELNIDEFARLAVNRGLSYRMIEQILTLGTYTGSMENTRGVSRLITQKPIPDEGKKLLTRFFNENLGIKCDSVPLRISFVTKYVPLYKTLVVAYFSEVCGKPLFTPTIGATPLDYFNTVELFRDALTIITLPKFTQYYLEVLDNLLQTESSKFVLIIGDMAVELMKIAQISTTTFFDDLLRAKLHATIASLVAENPYNPYSVYRAFLAILFNTLDLPFDAEKICFPAETNCKQDMIQYTSLAKDLKPPPTIVSDEQGFRDFIDTINSKLVS